MSKVLSRITDRFLVIESFDLIFESIQTCFMFSLTWRRSSDWQLNKSITRLSDTKSKIMKDTHTCICNCFQIFGPFRERSDNPSNHPITGLWVFIVFVDRNPTDIVNDAINNFFICVWFSVGETDVCERGFLLLKKRRKTRSLRGSENRFNFE